MCKSSWLCLQNIFRFFPLLTPSAATALLPWTNHHHLSPGLSQQDSLPPSFLLLVLNIAVKGILLKLKLHLVTALLKSPVASNFTGSISPYLPVKSQHIRPFPLWYLLLFSPATMASFTVPEIHQSCSCLGPLHFLLLMLGKRLALIPAWLTLSPSLS